MSHENYRLVLHQNCVFLIIQIPTKKKITGSGWLSVALYLSGLQAEGLSVIFYIVTAQANAVEKRVFAGCQSFLSFSVCACHIFSHFIPVINSHILFLSLSSSFHSEKETLFIYCFSASVYVISAQVFLCAHSHSARLFATPFASVTLKIKLDHIQH